MTHAVACLSGRTLRYAEVADGRLRRLGAADFDTDAERAVFADGDDAAVAAVGDALEAGLSGTSATALIWAVHPTVTTSFFTPLPAGLAASARDQQIHQEAALLADLAPAQTVRVRAASVRTEAHGDGAREWFHVVHVADGVHDRLGQIASALGVPGYDLVDTTRAVAAVAVGDGLSVVLGAYASHTEVAVVRDGVFAYGTHGPSTAPADTAYFALASLQQSGAQATDADRLLVYGDAATPERTALAQEFTATEATPLDAFARMSRRPDGDASDLAVFAPVMGATRDAGVVRVTGGTLARRTFDAPPGDRTRPTTDRVREALFSALGSRMSLSGTRVLDLFAGSGALGLEALSRGAARATFVERHGRTLGVARANATALGVADRADFVRSDAWPYLNGVADGAFDLAVADPPYALSRLAELPAALRRVVAPDGLAVLEHDGRHSFHDADGWLQSRVYGGTVVSLFEGAEG